MILKPYLVLFDNDQTNSISCTSALHKILITGLIKSSEYASVEQPVLENISLKNILKSNTNCENDSDELI